MGAPSGWGCREGKPVSGLPSGPEDSAVGKWDAATDDPRRPSRWVVGLLVLTFLGLALSAALSFVSLPYAVMSPGPITNTLGEVEGQKIIDVPAGDEHPTDGKLYFTTVRVLGGPDQRVTIFDLLQAGLDPAREVFPEAQLFPKDATREQVQQENAAEMEGSQKTAAAVAERALGRDVPVSVEVSDVLAGSAADGLLRKGDVIVSVDGTPATSPAAVRDAVRKHQPGEQVAIVVRRDGGEIELTPVAKDREGIPTIGVIMLGRYQLPVDVTIHAGAVGGPSAGMMFALGIYDVLTPGDLTGGTAIAGTGTITDDGAVGPIGGIRQKLVGARAGGASVFLAPADNCAEVVGHVPDGLQVVRVATFTEALDAVGKVAAGETSGLPTCSSTP